MRIGVVKQFAGEGYQPGVSQRFNEAVELLERILEGTPGEVARGVPLLQAIADGTFGHMKRPADRGKGLAGVAAHADDYHNPAVDLLEEGMR